MAEETLENTPKGDAKPEIKGIKIPGSRLPPPRFRLVQDTSAGKNASKFFSYWCLMPEHLEEFVEVKVYRLWPNVNLKATDPTRKTITWEVIEGKCPFTPEGYIQESLDRWGSGGWRMIMNERGISGKIMECAYEAIDMDAAPPRLDLKTLVVGAHQNKWYVDWLKQNKIELPWEKETPTEEDNDMSGVNDALKTMVEHGQKLADKNMEMVEQVAEAKIEAIQVQNQRPAEPSEEEHATRESIRLVADSAREAIGLMRETTGKQYDTVEVITAVGNLLGRTGAREATADGGSDRMIEITKLLLETQAKGYEGQLAAVRESVEAIKAVVLAGPQGQAAAAAVTVAPPKTFIEQLKEAEEIASMFGRLSGNGGDRDRDRDRDDRDRDEAPRVERPPEKSVGAMIAENLPALGMILMAGANILYNMRLKPGEAPQNPAEAMKQNPLAGAAAAAAVPGAAAQPQAAATPEQVRAQWVAFVAQIRGPFLAHFFSQDQLPVGRDMNYKASGYTLAYFLCTDGTGAHVTDRGRAIYLAVKEQLGPAGLDQLIRQDFELWSKLDSMKQRYAQFMGEFFTYDDWLQKQADGDDGDDGDANGAADPAKKTAA